MRGKNLYFWGILMIAEQSFEKKLFTRKNV